MEFSGCGVSYWVMLLFSKVHIAQAYSYKISRIKSIKNKIARIKEGCKVLSKDIFKNQTFV